VSCEIPVSHFGERADLRPEKFFACLSAFAREGLHIDYEASWGFFVRTSSLDAAMFRDLPGKITRGISHQVNPHVIRLTFSRVVELASQAA
jgi:hypothetical protein